MTTIDFETVRKLGLSLPDVFDGTVYGSPALKLGGKVLACIPVNKSAETNCIAVHIDFEHRTQLLEQHPEIYYITNHYEPYQTLLARLSKINRIELDRLLRAAHAFVSLSRTPKKRAENKRSARLAPSAGTTKSLKKR